MRSEALSSAAAMEEQWSLRHPITSRCISLNLGKLSRPLVKASRCYSQALWWTTKFSSIIVTLWRPQSSKESSQVNSRCNSYSNSKWWCKLWVTRSPQSSSRTSLQPSNPTACSHKSTDLLILKAITWWPILPLRKVNRQRQQQTEVALLLRAHHLSIISRRAT